MVASSSAVSAGRKRTGPAWAETAMVSMPARLNTPYGIEKSVSSVPAFSAAMATIGCRCPCTDDQAGILLAYGADAVGALAACTESASEAVRNRVVAASRGRTIGETRMT